MEEIPAASFLAYRQIAAMLNTPSLASSGSYQVFAVSAGELASALETDIGAWNDAGEEIRALASADPAKRGIARRVRLTPHLPYRAFRRRSNARSGAPASN